VSRPPPASDAATAARMRAVRRSGTKEERAVRAWLRARGIAYRIAPKTLPGRPDLANRRHGWALFVHGCFWHGHPGCAQATMPKRNGPFWADKIDANRRRDAQKEAALRALGFDVVVVWGCEARVLGRGGPPPAALASLVRRHQAQRCPASSS
jgi:DNA mismatch endonuclease, patch repair protein